MNTRKPSSATKKKEVPNTPNVAVWPEEFVKKEASAEKKSNSASKSKAAAAAAAAAFEAETTEVDYEDTWAAFFYSWLEYFEFYIFLFGGSLLWYIVVTKTLDAHNFPYHLYIPEVFLIVTIPIVFLLALLTFIQRNVKSIKMD